MSWRRSLGPAEARLVALINEEMLFARKQFGMFGRISWAAVEVDPEVLTLRIATHRAEAEYPGIGRSVRNALLAYLQDMVPCRTVRLVFSGAGREHRAQELAFVRPEDDAKPGPSNVILIEEHAGPLREKGRPLFADAWRVLCEQHARPG